MSSTFRIPKATISGLSGKVMSAYARRAAQPGLLGRVRATAGQAHRGSLTP